ISPKRNGLGTGDGLHSWVLQEPVSTGDNPRECDSQGTSKDALVREGKTYKCKEWGKVFNKNSLLFRNHQIHAGVNVWSAWSAGSPMSAASVERPSKNSLGAKNVGKPFTRSPAKCSECGKTFTYHSIFFRHSMAHPAGKPYECKECGKGFYYGYSLTRHTRSHTAEKPYECLERTKAFGYHSAFARLSKIHSGGKSL
uniref:C2H2-type domain-containing protein n=1 Tax=Colobus angolensis palliatus TaxID=336983 RepID=A0A2K5HU04_COLAP